MKKLLLLLLLFLVMGTFAFCESNKSENIPESVWKLDLGKTKIETLLKYDIPVILDFGADWCGPCKEFHPILVKANQKYKNTALIKYANVDNYEELSEKLNVSGIPCQFFWTKDGKPYRPSKAILEEIDFEFTYNKKGELLYTYHECGLSLEEIDMIIKDMITVKDKK